jgi:hypothetical protein
VYRVAKTGCDAMRCDAGDAGRMEKGRKKRRGWE